MIAKNRKIQGEGSEDIHPSTLPSVIALQTLPFGNCANNMADLLSSSATRKLFTRSGIEKNQIRVITNYNINNCVNNVIVIAYENIKNCKRSIQVRTRRYFARKIQFGSQNFSEEEDQLIYATKLDIIDRKQEEPRYEQKKRSDSSLISGDEEDIATAK